MILKSLGVYWRKEFMKCVSVVGIGPGNELYLSIAAKETLEESDLIVGYKKYVELVEEYLPEKGVFIHRYDKRGGPL